MRERETNPDHERMTSMTKKKKNPTNKNCELLGGKGQIGEEGGGGGWGGRGDGVVDDMRGGLGL